MEHLADRAMVRWAALVMRRPAAALAGLLLLSFLAGWAAAGLRVDSDSSRMLSPEMPFQAETRAINQAFPTIRDTVIVVVQSPLGDAADAATAALRNALQGAAGVERVFAPAADPFLVAHGLLYDDVDELSRQLSRLSQSSDLIAQLRADRTVEGFLSALGRATTLAAEADFDAGALARFHGEAAAVLAAEREGRPRPFDWGAVVGDDPAKALTTRVLTVEPRFEFSRLVPARTAIESVERAVAGLDPALASLVTVGVTGEPVLRAEELESVIATLGWSFALSAVLVSLILFLTLGRAGRVALALSTVLVTLVLTAGIAAATVGTLNLVSVAFVVLMVGLGIDFAIHMMTQIDELLAPGGTVEAAVRAAAGRLGAALLLSALTTSIAFLAFATTDFVGMAQLGLIGGIGVLIALGVAITMIPAVLALAPALARGRGPLKVPRLPPLLARAGVLTVLAVAVAGLVIAPNGRFDADPMGLRDQNAGSVVAFDRLMRDPDLAPLRLSVMADTAAEAEALADALSAVPEVRRTVWLGDLVPDRQAEKLELIDFAYPSILHAVEGEPLLTELGEPASPEGLRALGTPQAAALADELDAWEARQGGQRSGELRGALFRFFPDLVDRLALQLEAGEVTLDNLPGALVDRFRGPDGRLRVEVTAEEDLTDDIARQRFVEAVAAVAPAVGGAPAQIVGASSVIGRAIVQATALALIGAALLAWLTLGRWTTVAAIVLPLLLAAAVTTALSVLLDIPFNYANIIVLPLMIGVGIDSGVHIAIRSQRSETSVFGTATARAVVASALTTIAAFSTLGLSTHRGTASMGIMLAIGLATSVIMIFTLTPLLVRFGRLRDRTPAKVKRT